MKEQEIIEGNKLIAEFMGASFHEDTPMILEKHVVSPAGNAIKCADKLRYNSSWDWLMPVVEKIDSLGPYKVAIIDLTCGINISVAGAEDNIYIDEPAMTKLETVNRAVIEFIKWHNNQPNQ